MATRKEYIYQINGNKLALVEKDFASTDGLNYVYSGISGDGITDDVPSGSTALTSPLTSVTDGIELEYAYSPHYRIESIAASDKETVSSYETAGGFLRFNGTAFSTEASVDYIVISGSGRWNGLHKVTGLNTAHYTTSTKYNGNNVVETPTVYTNITALADESSEIDLPNYLSKALVYYVKGKLAEDQMNLEVKTYMMKEFVKMLEKHESSKISGARVIMTGSHSIR